MMFLRKWILCVVCIILLISITGCDTEYESQGTKQSIPSGSQEATIPDVCPPSVMIDGKMYRDWNLDPIIDPNAIREEEILGYITSVVAITTVPTKNDEANYGGAHNAPYARWTDETYGEVYVIKYGYGWHILVPEGYPIR